MSTDEGEVMKGMIDIHSHILPGMDDGPRTLDDALDLAKMAVDEGVRTIVATPHFKNGRFDNNKSDIELAVSLFNTELAQRGIPLSVLCGQETRLNGEMVQDFHNGELQTVNNTDYLLVEFPSNHIPSYSRQLFFELQQLGLQIVIVHPERNQQIAENPNELYELAKMGVLAQVTAASLTGHFGKKTKRLAIDLIEANLVHFVASDVHNTTNRCFCMREACAVIEEKFGAIMVDFFKSNAKTLCMGLPVDAGMPEPVASRKLFGLF